MTAQDNPQPAESRVEQQPAEQPAEQSAVQPRNPVRSFVRRGSRLGLSLEHTWQNHSSDYLLELERGSGYTSVSDRVKISWPEVFGQDSDQQTPLIVEIGSGTGDQIVAAAERHPEYNFLALEVWRPGIATLISQASKAGVSNLKVIEADAAQAIPILFQADSLTEVWTFFPDPWPKKRHQKRRLVQAGFAAEIARILIPGGVWRLATDWPDYAWQMRDVVAESPLLTNPYAGERPHLDNPEDPRGGFAPRWEGRVLTKFEIRGTDSGRQARDVVGIKLAAPAVPTP